MRMDDRSSKRARQQREGGGGGGGGLPAGAENEFGAGFPRASLAGCHLEVKPSQTHLFVGMAIELKVSILNDEDVVQQTTQGINVSITGEDGRVVATHPNMFELTPQRPALLDGSTTFHLLLWEGCVRTGNRIKVHVETSSGRGREQIKADSEPIMVCRSALTVVSQPPESWYKDEGGKNNCIAIEATVREKLPSGQVGQAQPGVPLTLALVYEAGTEVHSQEILQVQSDTQLVTNEHGRANLKFKITEVSQRHQSQRFCVKICPDVRLAPEFSNVAPVVTVPVMVLSKRKNRRLKAEKMAQSAAGGYVPSSSGMGNMAGLMWATAGANGHLPPPNMDVVSSLPPSHWPSPAAPSILNGAPAGRGGRMGSSPPSAQHQHLQQQQQQPHLQHNPQQEAVAAAVNALHRAPGGGAVAPQAPVSAPVEDAPLRVPPGATGSLLKVFRWTDAVLQLLQMELQWQHIGYERDEADGSACYSRPLFRCPVCRVCKGSAQPHQKHAADCKLSGLLAEFSGRRNSEFAALVEQQQQLRGGGSSRSSASPPVSSGMAGTRGGGGSGGGGAAAAAGGRGGADGRGLKDGYGEGNGAAARIAEMHRGPASVILGLKNAPEGASGEGGPGGSLIRESPPGRDREDGNGNVVSVPLSSMRDQSGHYLPPVQSHELLRAGSGGMSRGLSIGFGGMFDNGMVPTSSGGGSSRDGEKEGLPRTGSVAPFVPKDDLTPAEERAQYIMLPEGAAGEGGGGGSKQLTVFSEKGLLLGFYDEKYDVGQQTHLPFQGVENNFSSNAKRALEAKLRAAIDSERSSRAAAASGGKAAADTMDTDDGGDNNTGGAQSKKRERGGRPTRSTSAAAAAAAAAAGGSGVKRESTGGGKKEPAAFPKVYTLSDFKSYQEMKRQVFYDWSLGPQMDMNVFDSDKTDGKAPIRTSPR